MGAIRSGDSERIRVIRNIEVLKNIKLRQVGTLKVFLVGTDGAYYCIVGGTGDWHRIPKTVIEQGAQDTANMYLVVARLLKTRIELYMGHMKPIIESRSNLKHTLRGDFQFDIKIPVSNRLPITQVPSARLYKISEFPYDLNIERDFDKKVKRHIKSLSSKELDELIKDLGISVDT